MPPAGRLVAVVEQPPERLLSFTLAVAFSESDVPVVNNGGLKWTAPFKVVQVALPLAVITLPTAWTGET